MSIANDAALFSEADVATRGERSLYMRGGQRVNRGLAPVDANPTAVRVTSRNTRTHARETSVLPMASAMETDGSTTLPLWRSPSDDELAPQADIIARDYRSGGFHAARTPIVIDNGSARCKGATIFACYLFFLFCFFSLSFGRFVFTSGPHGFLLPAGWAGERAPRITFRPIVAKPNRAAYPGERPYVGNDVREVRAVYYLLLFNSYHYV